MTRESPGPGTLLPVIAAQGLPGVSGLKAMRPLTTQAFANLMQAVARQRIQGHLVAAIENGLLPATEHQDSLAREAHLSVLATDLLLERLLVETSTLLTGLAVSHRALKGPAVARTAYPEPALRSFGDVDLLIDAASFDDTVEALRAAGGIPRFEDPRPRFTARFGKGVCVVTPSGLEIDLHRVFNSGAFGLAIDQDELLRESDSVVIAGTAIPVLSAPYRFLHACYHAALGSPRPRFSSLRDIAQIASTTSLDNRRVLSIATGWRGLAVLQRALFLTRVNLTANFDSPLFRWAETYVPSRFECRALESYVSDSASYARQAAVGLWALPTWRQRAAYAQALLFPSSHYLQQREGSHLRRWRRALSLATSRNTEP